jgi:hypothetical protein
MVGRVTASPIASASAASCLLVFTYGLIRLPDDQAGLMGFGHQWKSTLP